VTREEAVIAFASASCPSES